MPTAREFREKNEQRFRATAQCYPDNAPNPDPIEAAVLVTFRTKVHADILMFGEIAVQLLKLMGHSGAAPGAILADDVPAALNRLQTAVTAQPTMVLKAANAAE